MFVTMLEKLPTFHDRLVATEWRFFAPNPCTKNEHWVREFYINLNIVSLSDLVLRIQEEEVYFGAEQINDIYGLRNDNMAQFEAKGCEPRTWLVEKLCPGIEVSWATTKMRILLHDFTFKAQIWLAIIYSRVSLCTNITYIPDMRGQKVACILENILLNVGRLVLSNIRHFKNRDGSLLLFSSLITELCRRDRVEEYPR